MKLLKKKENIDKIKEIKTDNDKKTKKLSKSAIVLIVGLCIIAIPCIVFLGIILSASLKTGKPILGDRFKNDLVNEISKSHCADIEKDIKALSNVELVEVELPQTGRLVVSVDVSDSLSEEETTKLAESIYETVIKTLPVNTYFTATDNARMYDLTINVYTQAQASDTRTYIIVTKNSQIELPSYQVVSKPLNEELAKELRGETQEEPEEETPAE